MHILNPRIDGMVNHFQFGSIGACFQNRRQGMVDGCVTVLLHLAPPPDVLVNQFNRYFTHIDTVRLVGTVLCCTEKDTEDIHATLAVLIAAPADPVPGIIRIELFQRKLDKIFSLVLPCERFVGQEVGDYLCRNLIGMLLLIFGQQSVDLVRTGKQQAVDPGLRAITRPDSSTPLVGFLVPVSQPDKIFTQQNRLLMEIL